MTPMQICIWLCNSWKVIWGHILTSWGQYTFLLITFALIELETWDNRQSVFLIETHQMLCNMDYLGHLVAFHDLDLRSNFEVDLLWLTYRYMIRFVSTRQTRWLLYDYFAVLVRWRPQFWPERKNGWSDFLLFFNDHSNAAFCLSPTLRSCVRRGRIPPPPLPRPSVSQSEHRLCAG